MRFPGSIGLGFVESGTHDTDYFGWGSLTVELEIRVEKCLTVWDQEYWMPDYPFWHLLGTVVPDSLSKQTWVKPCCLCLNTDNLGERKWTTMLSVSFVLKFQAHWMFQET